VQETTDGPRRGGDRRPAAAADWANHLAMMAAHAAGDFGAEHAQAMWVSAWTHAPKNLERGSASQRSPRGSPSV
jgi:hypothetical protein